MYSKKNLYIYFVVLSIIFLFSGCEDSQPLEPEDHFEAVGLRLYSSGILEAEIFKGETSDTLHVSAGSTGDGMEITFLDENKNEIGTPTEDGTYFDWEMGDTTIAVVWQHPGEEGGYEFHLTGKTPGTTTLQIFVMHHDHVDIKSGYIPVKVN